jgi:signal transduction histidine kinase/ligand-binding sensor domain-containing protein
MILLLYGSATAFSFDLHNTVLDTWNTDNGLPQNSVHALMQTRDGYLWLGTQEGLVRYDGVRFTLFNRRNIRALKQNDITALLEASDGSTWLGTFGGGVTQLKENSSRTITMQQGLADDIVNSLLESKDGSIWICSMGGLNRWKDGKLISFTTRNGLPHSRVNSVAEDRSGTLWIATDGGLVALKDGSLRTAFTVHNGLPSNLIRVIRIASDGALWAGMLDAGLIRIENQKITIFDTNNGLANQEVTALYEDHNQSLWVGTTGSNLQRFENGKLVSYPRNLAGKIVSSILEDSEGNLWVGTSPGGLFRIREATIHTLLEEHLIWSVYEDSKNSKWIGTSDHGLFQYQNDQWRTFGPAQGLADPEVFSIAEDRSGTLWIGTRNGLNWMRNGTIIRFPMEKRLPNFMIRALFVDRDGTVWIGTYGGGLASYKAGELHIYTTKAGLPSDLIRYIFEDNSGSLWISTYGGGISRFQNHHFTNYSTKEGLSFNVAGPIYQDEDGVLWIGTIGGGLNRFENGRFTTFDVQNGFFDDKIFQILEDEKNNFWLSSNNGIFCIARKELNAYARGETRSYHGTALGLSDGMRTAECNGGSQQAGWKMRDGSLWFPTVRGIAIVHPDHIKRNHVPPRVILESVRADETSVALNQRTEFRPGTKTLEFQYTGIHFSAPREVYFRYQLEGFDKDWIEAGARRAAYYTNIPPGSYKFHVTARNKDGVWDSAGASFAFRLNPYFYQTKWFILVCSLFVAVLAWSLYKLRVQQLVRQNITLEKKVAERTSTLRETAREAAVLEERNRIAQDLHDNLAQGLAGIVLKIDAAKRALNDAPGEARQHLEDASDQARDSLEETRRSVRALHPLLLERSDLFRALTKLTQQIADGAPVKVECKLQGTPRTLSKDVELNLLRIAQEGLSNALKHSNAKEIAIQLVFGSRQIELHIQDNGSGFQTSKWTAEEDHGIGLAGMHSRAEKIGGTLTIRSQKGSGTEILINVPA